MFPAFPENWIWVYFRSGNQAITWTIIKLLYHKYKIFTMY